jgi:hypothetical protein
MENVGLREQLQTLIQSFEKIGKLSWGMISLDRTAEKQEADQMVEVLLNDGFELKKTERSSYEVERQLYLPGTHFSVCVKHRPSEQDRIDILKEQMKKAADELAKLEELEKVNA